MPILLYYLFIYCVSITFYNLHCYVTYEVHYIKISNTSQIKKEIKYIFQFLCYFYETMVIWMTFQFVIIIRDTWLSCGSTTKFVRSFGNAQRTHLTATANLVTYTHSVNGMAADRWPVIYFSVWDPFSVISDTETWRSLL